VRKKNGIPLWIERVKGEKGGEVKQGSGISGQGSVIVSEGPGTIEQGTREHGLRGLGTRDQGLRTREDPKLGRDRVWWLGGSFQLSKIACSGGCDAP